MVYRAVHRDGQSPGRGYARSITSVPSGPTGVSCAHTTANVLAGVCLKPCGFGSTPTALWSCIISRSGRNCFQPLRKLVYSRYILLAFACTSLLALLCMRDGNRAQFEGHYASMVIVFSHLQHSISPLQESRSVVMQYEWTLPQLVFCLIRQVGSVTDIPALQEQLLRACLSFADQACKHAPDSAQVRL